MKTGSIDLPLHPGSCPRWLFSRMRRLAAALSEVIIDEYGTEEYLRRLSNPTFFQSFICVSGMDWHSSGGTTTLSAAIKLALDDLEMGVVACGGKGKTSKKTPEEIEKGSEKLGVSTKRTEELLKATKLSAKVDSNCIQDNYCLYHHTFLFDEKGTWTVIQQGMHDEKGYARRYHWFDTENFVEAPPNEIIGFEEKTVLNLVSNESEETRKASVDLVKDNPVHLEKYVEGQRTLFSEIVLPERHEILNCDLTKRDWKMLQNAYEMQPENYEELVALRGMGGKGLRSLALVSKLIYGAEPDWKDPVKYSFAHGGKDGYPYMVNRKVYDESIEFLRDALIEAKAEKNEKKKALKRLESLI